MQQWGKSNMKMFNYLNHKQINDMMLLFCVGDKVEEIVNMLKCCLIGGAYGQIRYKQRRRRGYRAAFHGRARMPPESRMGTSRPQSFYSSFLP